jgi:homoserine dehydrogenase
LTAPLRVGLAGLGTVGAGVVKLLDTNAALIERRADRRIEVVAVSARDRSRERGIDLGRFEWVDDATTLSARGDVDAVVELIGGADGLALTLARATLSDGKPFVTANKALLAYHGLELAALAESQAVPLKYEAAVAGGIPVIKALREGAAANEIARIYGILNGTCNYILSRMEAEALPFAAVLADAQAQGFAEADPSFDIDGIDSAHKLSILAALAFGSRIDFAAVAIAGIRAIEPADIEHAATLGFRIKLIGLASATAEATGPGALFQRVHPCLVPHVHPLAHVDGALNAVVAEGNFVGRLLFQGRGAGAGPTASAVVADLIDVARGEVGPAFAMPTARLLSMPAADASAHEGRFYLRLTVADRPGVLAELTAALAAADVSIESLIQRGHSANGGVYVVMVTHRSRQSAVDAALARMASSNSVTAPPMMLHILDF